MQHDGTESRTCAWCGKVVTEWAEYPEHGTLCIPCDAMDDGDAEIRRIEENEAGAILDSMHRYGWCYE